MCLGVKILDIGAFCLFYEGTTSVIVIKKFKEMAGVSYEQIK